MTLIKANDATEVGREFGRISGQLSYLLQNPETRKFLLDFEEQVEYIKNELVRIGAQVITKGSPDES